MYQATEIGEAVQTGRVQVRILGGNAPVWAPGAVPLRDESGTPLWVLASSGALPEGQITHARIQSLSHTAQCCGEDIGIGQVFAAEVRCTVSGVLNLLGTQIRPEIGVETEEGTKWMPLGSFAVTECSRGDDVTRFTANDAAYYALGGAYVPRVSSGATVYEVLLDLLGQCGLEAEQTTLNLGLGIVVQGELSGHSCREMLGYLAALCARNAMVTREGMVRFVWFTQTRQSVTAGEYYSGELSNGGLSRLSGLRCTVPGEEAEQTLMVGESSKAVEVDCPFMTQNRLEAIWYELGGYEYCVGTVSFHGGVLTEPGDIVSLTNREGVTISVPVMQVQLTVDGGCRCTITSAGEGETVRRSTVPGQLEGRLARAQNTASRAMLSANGKNKVFHQATAPAASEGLTEGDIWFNTMQDNQISTWTGSEWSVFQLGEDAIENLSISNAKIKDGTIQSAKIAGLDAGKITTGVLDAARIAAGSITADKIDVSDLFAREITARDVSIGGYGYTIKGGVDHGGVDLSSPYARISAGNGFSIQAYDYDVGDISAYTLSIGGRGGSGNPETAVYLYGPYIRIGAYDGSSRVNLCGTVQKDGKPLNSVVEQNGAISVNANSAVDGSFSVERSGYTPIGVVGHYFNGTGTSYLSAHRLLVSGNNVYYSVRNYADSNNFSGTLYVKVLYMPA